GYRRPYGGPNLWSSEKMDEGKPEWLELRWESEMTAKEIHLIFNDDVNEDLINLHHHRTPFDIIPELVKNYTIEAYLDGGWTTLLRVTDNRQRKRVHLLEGGIDTSRLRVVIDETNGCPRAEIVEIRVY